MFIVKSNENASQKNRGDYSVRTKIPQQFRFPNPECEENDLIKYIFLITLYKI